MKYLTIIKKIYQWYRIKRIQKVKVNYDGIHYPIYVPQGAFLEKIRKKGVHEPSLTTLIYKNLEVSDIFWDVGAARGFHTLLAAQKIKNENIHAFEPDDFFWNILQYNLKKFQINAKSNKLFIGNEDKENKKIRGDMYAKKNGIPDIVKIDIEGGEIEALQGMKNLLENEKVKFFIEVHPKRRPQTHPFVFEFLKNKNRKIKQVIDFRKGEWSLKEIEQSDEIIFSDNYMLVSLGAN